MSQAEPSLTVRTVNLDCGDAHEMARFYGGLLGWDPMAVEPDWVLMRDPQGGTGLSFQQMDGYERPTWPEKPGRQQKMIHLDVKVTPPDADGPETDPQAAGQAALEQAVGLALSLGGTLAESQPRTDLRASSTRRDIRCACSSPECRRSPPAVVAGQDLPYLMWL